jgi:hypothetical protein
MNEQDDPGTLKKMIVRDLQLEKEEDLLKSDSIGLLKEKLTGLINGLLHKDYHRLLNAMYRLDIDEKLFRDAFSGMHSPGVASRLADLVIKREIEKARTRKKYRT